MKKPSTIYRYNQHKELEKHKIVYGCAPYIAVPSPYPGVGDVWRCRCEAGDFSGFAQRQEAKAEEIQNTKRRIAEDQAWLEKLEEK